jgi:four helix bundle protein
MEDPDMPRVERFEDLIAWQKARELTKDVYLVSKDGQFARDFGLCGQIQRASVSTMSNIAEGFERTGPSEFHQFLSIAKGSNAEVRSDLYVALDVGYINDDQFNYLYAKASEVGRVLGGLRISVAESRPRR